MSEIFYLPAPKNLTPEQEVYWIEELEKVERRAEEIKRILGILAITERGIE